MNAPAIVRLPPRPPAALARLRCLSCWIVAAVIALVVASFWSLDLRWSAFLEPDARSSMARFLSEFFPPEHAPRFLASLLAAAGETLAMSALGTLLAATAALVLCLPAARTYPAARGLLRQPMRFVLNALRAVPELVWATLLLVIAGLGPMAGTLALALHTSGVLGRLFAESIENAPPDAGAALRIQGTGEARIFLYATLPQVAPQLLSYTLYRWENNIRAATILGVVGAGGLGQMLSFHLSLFQMGKVASDLGAMLLLVLAVDLASYLIRRRMAA